MTANEMRLDLLTKIDSLLTHSAPNYSDRAISILLSDAEKRIVLSKYNPWANKYQKGFESNEQRRRNLSQLIKPASISGGEIAVGDQDGIHPNGVIYDLPEDFLFSIEEGVKIDDSTTEIQVKPIRHDEYFPNITNPYTAPCSELAWRMDISRTTHEQVGVEASKQRSEIIVAEGSVINDYRIRYISMPGGITCDATSPENQVHSILDEITHGEIVDEAVSMAVAAVQKEAYQLGMSEANKSE